MATNGPVERWGKLTRADIPFCDDKAKEMVLLAMELGALGRISSGNHVIIRAPNSTETIAVARSMSTPNRSSQNTYSAFRKAFGMTVEEAKQRVKKMTREQRRAALAEHRGKHEAAQELQAQQREPVVVCEFHDPPLPFFETKEWQEHVELAHFVCKQEHAESALPGKWGVFPTLRGLKGHTRILHEGHRPRPKGVPLEELQRQRQERLAAEAAKRPVKKAAVPEPKREEHKVGVATPIRETVLDLTKDEAVMVTPEVVIVSLAANAEERIEAIRALVGGGESPELKAKVDALTEENASLKSKLEAVQKQYDDLHTKWSMLREQFSTITDL